MLTQMYRNACLDKQLDIVCIMKRDNSTHVIYKLIAFGLSLFKALTVVSGDMEWFETLSSGNKTGGSLAHR